MSSIIKNVIILCPQIKHQKHVFAHSVSFFLSVINLSLCHNFWNIELEASYFTYICYVYETETSDILKVYVTKIFGE